MSLTVIIPVFNTEKYLEKCLQSVLQSKYNDLEIICINDASTDNSLNILKDYAKKDKRITLINLEENVGGGKAKNIAIDSIKTDFFTIIDSDDYFADSAIDLFYEKIKENNDVTYFDYYAFTDNSKDLIFKKGTSAPWSKVYKTNFINQYKIRFYEGRGTHDNPFYILAKSLAEKTNYYNTGVIEHLIDRPGSIQTEQKKSLKYIYASIECYFYSIMHAKSIGRNDIIGNIQWHFIDIFLNTAQKLNYNKDYLSRLTEVILPELKNNQIKFTSYKGLKYYKKLIKTATGKNSLFFFSRNKYYFCLAMRRFPVFGKFINEIRILNIKLKI